MEGKNIIQGFSPGQRLRTARKALNLTLRGFAEPLGVAFQSVHNWEKDLSPIPTVVAKAIEQVYSISPEWLLTGKGEMYSTEIESLLTAGRKLLGLPLTNKYTAKEDSGLVLIPIGDFWMLTDEDPAFFDTFSNTDRCFGFPVGWLKERIGVHQKDLCLMRVSGDSMLPTLTSGDIIMIDKTAPGVKFREGIWVFELGDSIYFKRVMQLGDAQYRATSDNAQYPSITFDKKDVIFRGRAVWLGKTL